MQQTLTVGRMGFRQFVFGLHKDMLVITLLGMTSMFFLYKVIYPYPDFYFDSYHYINLALDSEFKTVWPIGYSLFLRAVHAIAASGYLLVVVQYLLLQFSSLWLAFTVFYYFNPPKWIKVTLLTFMAVNPLYLYLANLVSSDILFTALSLAWLTILIQMVFDAKMWHALLQGPLLAYLFLIRYQALYYPLVMLAALWLAEFNVLWKVISALIAFGLMGWIIHTTKVNNQRRYAMSDFSGQSGWILANNAMYMIPHINKTKSDFTSEYSLKLDRFIDSFFRVRALAKRDITPWDGPKFMLQDGGMWNYLWTTSERWIGHRGEAFWGYNRLGPQWKNYGKDLILSHPLAHVRYYLLPNAGVYLLPLQEQFKEYNMGSDMVTKEQLGWFQFPYNRVGAHWVKGSFYLTWIFRPLFLLLNLYLLIGGVILIRQKKHFLLAPVHKNLLILMAVFFVLNAAFLIVAAPVMMRYMVFGLVLGVVLALLITPLLFIRYANTEQPSAQ